MARPVVHDEKLREKLLSETAEFVAREGAARLSLRTIASSAGTSTSAVYSLFGGKTQLLNAVTVHAFDSLTRAQHAAEPDGLRALGIAYRAWGLANPTLYRLMFGGQIAESIDDCPPDLPPESLAPLLRSVGARFDPATPPEMIKGATVTVWAQVHGVVSLELSGATPPGIDWSRIYDHLLDVIDGSLPNFVAA